VILRSFCCAEHTRCKAQLGGRWADVEHELAPTALAHQTSDEAEKVISELSAQAGQAVTARWAEIERIATSIVDASIFREVGASAHL
jgi:hypothetical protein